MDMSGGVDAYLSRPRDFGEASPLGLVRRGAHVLVIGSGCGADVLDALRFGATSITAVEINPIIASLGRTRMRDWWGGLYTRPEVHVVVDEARSYVRRSVDRFDAIIARHTISNSAVASGALSLSENYLLTTEAFDDYFTHLSPGGSIVFTRPEAQMPRLLATVRGMFDRHGLGSAADNVFLYRTPLTREEVKRFGSRGAFDAGLIVRLTPLSPSDVAAIEKELQVHSVPPPGYEGTLPQTLYSPLARAIDPVYARILDEPEPSSYFAGLPYDPSPVTDDRPFFIQRIRWSRLRWSDVASVFAQGRGGRMAMEDKPIAEATLLVILAQATLVAAILILLPLVRFAREGLRARECAPTLLYFASLGLAFIFVEMALLQRFMLFLGEPVYTLAAVLASLLFFSGLGSAVAGGFAGQPQRALRVMIPVLLLVLVVTTAIVPLVFGATLGDPLSVRIAIAIALVAPLGVMMGMPFATGLRAIETTVLVPWAWGINAFFTVIGSIGGMILGMAFGFRIVLLCAGLIYLLGTLPFTRAQSA